MGQTFTVRVLHLISHNAVSGPEKNAIDLALGMDERGHDVFVAGEGGNWMQESLTGSRCRWVELPFKKLGFFKSVLRVYEVVRQEQIEIIHVHLSRASLVGWVVGKLCKVPVVATVHVATTNRVFKSLAKPPNHLIAVSAYLRDFLVGTGIPAQRVSVIHIGSRLTPTPTFAEEKALEFLAGERVVVMVGKVSSLKGSDIAVEAFENLENDYPNLHLVMVGEDQNEFARALKAKLKSSRIHFLGLHQNLASFYLRSEFSILPTEIETFGMVVTESMLCGRPVIGSNRGALPELIRDGETGLIVEREASALEAAMRKLLSDRDFTKKLGSNAQADAISRFTVKPMLDRVENLYESIVKQNSAGV
jgi:glycosyltransferase involved in cell wall biosynthesis